MFQRVQWRWHWGESVLLITQSTWWTGWSLLETFKKVFGSYDAGSYRNFNICWMVLTHTVVRSKLSRRFLDSIWSELMMYTLEGPTRWLWHSLANSSSLGIWSSIENMAIMTTKQYSSKSWGGRGWTLGGQTSAGALKGRIPWEAALTSKWVQRI